jgi:hypothetical protein
MASEETQSEIYDSLSVSDWKKKTVLVDSSGVLQCSLHLYSEGPRRLVGELLSEERLDANRVAQIIRNAEPWEPLDECLLAMAFPLALLGNWKVARLFAKGAVAEGRRASSAGLHQSLFFLCVCERMTRRSNWNLEASLQHIAEARRLRSEQVGKEDPRYVKEHATIFQVALAGERNEARRGKRASTDPEKAVEVERLLRLALELTEDDLTLRLLIHNGLCYLFLTDGWPERATAATSELRELLRLLSIRFRVANDWPANVLDTVGWGCFKLWRKGVALKTPSECALLLEIALGKRHLSRDDRDRVARHLAFVQQGMASAPE